MATEISTSVALFHSGWLAVTGQVLRLPFFTPWRYTGDWCSLLSQSKWSHLHIYKYMNSLKKNVLFYLRVDLSSVMTTYIVRTLATANGSLLLAILRHLISRIFKHGELVAYLSNRWEKRG